MVKSTAPRRPKTIYSLDTPYAPVAGPTITTNVQETILGLLCDLLQPIGQHRSQNVTRSRGKRHKKHKHVRSTSESVAMPQKGAKDATLEVLERPNIHEYITLGFNTTTRHLEALSRIPIVHNDARPVAARLPAARPVAAVFVPSHGHPTIVHDHLPMLCKTASLATPSSLPVRLVFLSKDAEERLASSLKIPRVGPIGLLEDAPGSAPLINYVREMVPALEVPWLHKMIAGIYIPVEIKAIHTTAPIEPKAKRNQRKGPPKRVDSEPLPSAPE